MAEEQKPSLASRMSSAIKPDEFYNRAFEMYADKGYSADDAARYAEQHQQAIENKLSRSPVAVALEKAREYYQDPSQIATDVLKGASMFAPLGRAGLAAWDTVTSATPANAGEQRILDQQMNERIRQSQGYADGGAIDEFPLERAWREHRLGMAEGGTAGGMGPMQSPLLQKTFEQENRPGVIVSPRPGKGGGPPIMPEAGAPYHPELEEDREPWSFATPDIIGAAKPPPVQHPVFNEPRMSELTKHTQRLFKDKNFHKLVEDMTGLQGLSVTPTVGTWKNEMEPSFILNHPDMDEEKARKLAHLMGFGFQQDATVHVKHNPEHEDGIPALLIGSGKKLTSKQIDDIHKHATQHGLDFTVTGDGKAAKFLHFGGDDTYDDFLDRVGNIADQAKLSERYHAKTSGDLINAKDYVNGLFGGAGGQEGLQTGTERSPDLFRRVVDHVLAPYAKAVAGEGYRLSPERLQETYGLTDEEREHVRNSLYPTGKKSEDRTTIPLMTGEEQLDVRPTGDKGASVGDVLFALQNRAAQKGQIDPGDFSDTAKKKIAEDIAKEVAFHVQNSDKSAIGWYDTALKKAKDIYHDIFPSIAQDKNKELLFDALLGITSQGNDVYSNSTHAARLFDKIENGMSLKDAVKDLRGSFGDKTRAIELNLNKFHDLIEKNGYDEMRDLFNQTKTVGEWNKILRTDPRFKVGGSDLKMQGGSNQKVTGWMVFGPKIGSFINNLHGDYSTLTADLWFSRTWNRLLGHNFIHTPLAEAKQYRDFRDALMAEYYQGNPNVGVGEKVKTVEGQPKYEKTGAPKKWLFGNDAQELSKEDLDRAISDPDEMLKLAQEYTDRYRKSGFKDKSDLRRRAKNWIENRELPVAAPRGDLERDFQQRTVEEAQKILNKKHGMNISIADIQAALWFHEKELFGKLGVASEKAQPADYADAAAKTAESIRNGDLYTVKSKEKKANKTIAPTEVE